MIIRELHDILGGRNIGKFSDKNTEEKQFFLLNLSAQSHAQKEG
jgi:hypothetical protein